MRPSAQLSIASPRAVNLRITDISIPRDFRGLRCKSRSHYTERRGGAVSSGLYDGNWERWGDLFKEATRLNERLRLVQIALEIGLPGTVST